MSDFAEMAEALEQVRTAPDPADKATAYESIASMIAVATVRALMSGSGLSECEDCGIDISEARRKAYPSAVCCVEYQTLRERRS
ncbi:TraR/DksA C4-type zinc finger protein [Pseudomonas songnenensis]|uniref:TraR/DksA family transcriptional regulator n=1 Tax=Pseudomonas songnenensis TaxID=1176259 RepID=A0ABX9UQL8_9PSED|nr:TraR/DksA C4-type zinc finger protein [Pseudomonas songnenensis]MCQ4302235.1 TraR/DksA C4-type zinc finger protein [Pseudomonas songnenensis]RMH95416.1 TraR/DksA family transcriptional regulator [Pseudomonas songnenensis]